MSGQQDATPAGVPAIVNSTACANKAGLFAQAARTTGGPRP
jgi:hypothetical protein